MERDHSTRCRRDCIITDRTIFAVLTGLCAALFLLLPVAPASAGVQSDAQLVIEKQSFGGDGTFEFNIVSTAAGSGSIDETRTIMTVDGSGSTSIVLPSGTFEITEIEAENFSLVSISCDTQSEANLQERTVEVFLESAATVVCTFTNVADPGSITIVKNTDGTDDLFSFESEQLGFFSIQTSGGTGERFFGELSAETYVITELENPDFNLNSLVCDGEDTSVDLENATATINLGVAEDVTCTFENLPAPGSISIIKTSDVAGDFSFTGTNGIGDFILSPPAGGMDSVPFTGLQPGTYVISEADAPGFDLESIMCSSDAELDFVRPAGTSGGKIFAIDEANRQVTIDLAPDENVSCTFNNVAQPGSITIVKTSDGEDATFTFGGDLGNFSITTSGGSGQQSFTELSADTYTVMETYVATAGGPEFIVTDIDCSMGDTDGGSVVDLANRSVDIDLDPGEDITCVFQNSEILGSITINKSSDAAGSFDFSGTGPDPIADFTLSLSSAGTASQLLEDLSAGTYTITEADNPDFDLNNIACTGESVSTDVNSRTATIDLSAGENVSCTFSNSVMPGSITIIKASDAAGSFDFTGTEPIGDFTLSTEGSGTDSKTFSGLLPDQYIITEAENADFNLDSILCESDADVEATARTGGDGGQNAFSVDEANRQVTIDLAAGENVTCTFTNSLQTGSITIFKSIDSGDATFDYTGDLGAFSITTSGQTGSRSFPDLVADTYVVTEAEADGYNFVDLSCSGDLDSGTGEGSSVDIEARTATIDLDPGESITCIFVSEASDDELIETLQRATMGFTYRRARNMLNAEPDRVSFQRRNPEALWDQATNTASTEKPVRYAFNATQGSTQFDFAATTARADRTELPLGPQLWVEGTYTRADDGGGALNSSSTGGLVDIDSEYGVVHIGADLMFTQNLLVGFMATFDRADEELVFFDQSTQTTTRQETDGTGWMAGPYVASRLAKNLFFNARLAFGTSDNQLNIENIVQGDDFKTERTLARAALTGNKVFDEKWRITPTVSVAYYEEVIDGFDSKTGVFVPAQTLELGRAEFEPELAYRHQYADGTTIEPQLALALVWDFEAPDDIAFAGVPVPGEEVRGRMEGGIQVNWASGTSMRLAASYDGIGAENYDAYSANVWLDVPIGRPEPRATRIAQPVTPPVQYKECPDGSRVEMLADCPVTVIDMPPPEPVEFVIYFDFDRYNLLPGEADKIDAALERIGDREIEIVILEGNTDRAGSISYNETLSVQRAQTVRSAMIERGIDPDLITYEAYGETRPAVPTPDGTPLRANRRTEVRIRVRQ